MRYARASALVVALALAALQTAAITDDSTGPYNPNQPDSSTAARQ